MDTNRSCECQRIELEGIRYVIVRESAFDQLCQRAGFVQPSRDDAGATPAFDIDRASLAEKLRRRRRAADLSQAELARRAGVRPETLNRIERGHSEPDFTTIRKLVVAMNAAEKSQAAS
jgi:DNA-binding XRE family transcriptional regulator